MIFWKILLHGKAESGKDFLNVRFANHTYFAKKNLQNHDISQLVPKSTQTY